MILSSKSGDWGGAHSFIVLREGARIEDITPKLSMLEKDVFGSAYEQSQKDGSRLGFYLHPITSIHLYENVEREFIGDGGNIQYLYALLFFSVLIILIACMNYMNLATAKSSTRCAEIGIRKVVGSKRSQLIQQHLFESAIVSLCSLLISLGLVELLLPAFNNLTGKAIEFNIVNNWYTVPILVSFALIVGFFAGIYPAFYLTAMKPVNILKGNMSITVKGHFRKVLILFQFTVSIALMIIAWYCYNQISYMLEKDLGFSASNIIVVNLGYELRERNEVFNFRQELKGQTSVVNASFCGTYPFGWIPGEWSIYKKPGDMDSGQAGYLMTVMGLDEDFIPTIEAKILAGRNFSHQFRTDTSAVILNETAVQQLGWQNPTGQFVYRRTERSWQEEDGSGNLVWKSRPIVIPYKVIGVVKDYHIRPLHRDIEPTIHSFTSKWFINILVRFTPTSDLKTNLQILERIWKKHIPDAALDFNFLDEQIENRYRKEIRFGRIIGIFTSVTVFIACLGIFGLIAFTAERRTKEIGIRKTLGASVSNIILLLTKETTQWVLISCVIAVPIGYLVVNRWLENFAYRIDISVWMFLIACVAALLIALLTVSSQAFRAARTNPVDSLRYE
jgi:putative ABC transport system permease protein